MASGRVVWRHIIPADDSRVAWPDHNIAHKGELDLCPRLRNKTWGGGFGGAGRRPGEWGGQHFYLV